MKENSVINKVFPQNCGDTLKIINHYKDYYYKCQFLNYPCEVIARKDKILKGSVMNYLIPSVYGKGYLGIGNYKRKEYKNIYTIWILILARCYGTNNPQYKNYGAKGVTVCNEWLNFQNFAAWYEEHYIEGYELDKDVLANISYSESKIYSPETCLLIPSGLNAYLAGDNLKSGVQERNGKFRVRIHIHKEVNLGTYSTFCEAKQIYAKEKYKCWLEEIEKYTLSQELKDILLKYDFSWGLKS